MSSRDFSDAHEVCSTERFRKVPVGHTLLWRQGDDLNADPLTAPPFPSRLIHQSELLRAKIFLQKSRCLVRAMKNYPPMDLTGKAALLRIFYTWSDTQIFVQKERRTSKWGLALEFQVSGLYPLCGSVPLSGISSHLKMVLSSAHRMLFRTAGELLVR